MVKYAILVSLAILSGLIPFIPHTIQAEPNITLIPEPPPPREVVLIEKEIVEEEVCGDYRDYGCSCMLYLQQIGHTIQGYDAKDLQPNSFAAQTGDVAIFRYPLAHAGHVIETYIDSFLMSECNYKPATCGSRIIQNDDPALIGFIHKI